MARTKLATAAELDGTAVRPVVVTAAQVEAGPAAGQYAVLAGVAESLGLTRRLHFLTVLRNGQVQRQEAQPYLGVGRVARWRATDAAAWSDWT